MTTFEDVVIQEDAYEGSDLSVSVGLSVQQDSVTLSTDGDYQLPPVYLTPDAARKLGNALHEAARIAEGLPSAGLFGGDA